MSRRRIDLPTLRAALWAGRAVLQVRRDLRKLGLEAAHVTVSPPALPPSAERGVLALLRRLPSTCLERALVLQRWHASRGRAREVVIGVKSPGESFEAHAWLDGAPDSEAASYEELMRLPAP
jgi:hypothetical protein